MQRAVSRGVAGLLDQPSVPLRIRYNPAECECPQWELEIYGRWERVELVSSRDSTPAVEPVLTYNRHPVGNVYRAEITLTSDRIALESGWKYPVYEVIDVSDE